MTKVCFIVGDNKTLHCGVKDYARTLAEALSRLDVYVEVQAADDWSYSKVLTFIRRLRASRFDIVHVQYPSIGFRGTLVPHLIGLLGIAVKSVVTIHEYSALPVAQRICSHIFRWTSDHMLFVSLFEQNAFQKQLRTLGTAQSVVPIGSNVPIYNGEPTRKPVILYFGQIRPNKGIEDFLALARLSHESILPLRFVIAGSYPERHSAYFERIKTSSLVNTEWLLDQTFEEVSKLLATSLAAYLPFPDGASDRRGSLLACLANRLPVISRIGPATGDLAGALLAAETPEQALEHLHKLVADPGYTSSAIVKARDLTKQFEWREIAATHQALYQQILPKGNPHRSNSSERTIPVP